MTVNPIHEELIARFRRHLEDSSAGASVQEASTAHDREAGNADLYGLHVELAALKNEVRIESRQFKQALDRFQELLAARAEEEAPRERQYRQRAEDQQRRTREERRPLLLELLELRDRMADGLAASDHHRPGIVARWLARERAWRAGVREGQVMVLRRLDQILAGQGVRPLPGPGAPLDLEKMRAVGVVDRPDLPNGVVVEERRRGYLWAEQLLRPAEVLVNKRKQESS
ncbi:MAG: nucleotide exchange factor GrpE [Magnetococcales bacterium]|nr:nucleotide exchange factor GrpE [Magnetococcales bacterium]